MPRDASQIVLDAGKVRLLLAGKTPKQVEQETRKRVMGEVVRRALRGEQITASLAAHLAEALGVSLYELIEPER